MAGSEMRTDRLVDGCHEHSDRRIDQDDPLVLELHRSASTSRSASSARLTDVLKSRKAAAILASSPGLICSTAERIALPSSRGGTALTIRLPFGVSAARTLRVSS